MNNGLRRRTYSTYGAIEGFDRLLGPDHRVEWPGCSPLIAMFRGDPGSGKSTLALQCACLGITAELHDSGEPQQGRPIHPRCVLYYVIDDFPKRILEKCHTFNVLGEHGGQFSVALWGDSIWKVKGKGPTIDDRDLSSGSPRESTTVLALIDYASEKGLEDLRSVIRSDVIVVSKAFAECVVVVDTITPLEWGTSIHRYAGGSGDRRRGNRGGGASQRRPERHDEPEACSGEEQLWPRSRFQARQLARAECVMSQFPGPNPAVIILVDEEGAQQGRDPYLAHMLVELHQGDLPACSLPEGYCERYLQIVKVSNSRHVRGRQKFRIYDKRGIVVLPSLIATAHSLEDDIREALGSASRSDGDGVEVPFGLEGLGRLGEIRPGSSSVVIGPQGTRKTRIALEFCRAGLKEKGKVAFLSLSDSSATVRRMGQQAGAFAPLVEELGDNWKDAVYSSDIDADLLPKIDKEKHRFIIQYVSMAYLPPEGFVAMVRRLLKKLGHGHGAPTRLVVDAISDLKGNYPRLSGVPVFLSALTKALAVEGVTSLFIFNDGDEASSEDRTIVDLVDNVFRLQARTLKGRRHVLLEVEELDNRWLAGREDAFYVVPRGGQAEGEPIPEELAVCAQPAEGDFYREQDGKLVPAKLGLFVNRCTDQHQTFSNRIRDVFDIPKGRIDHNLAHGSPKVVHELLRRLREDRESGYVVAVDLAYLRSGLLEHFRPLKERCTKGFIDISNTEGENQSGDPLALCKWDGQLRVLPIFADCSLMLCNLDILRECKTKVFEKLLKPIERAMAGQHEQIDLPVLKLDDLRDAAGEFSDTVGEHYFFGFADAPTSESRVCALYNILGANGVIFRRGNWQQRHLKQGMTDFVRFFLPAPQGDKEKRNPRNCLFFHTWQSLAISEAPTNCVPVKFGRLWRGTRGGWCWGVLDNRVGVKQATKVVEFATSRPMNSYLIEKSIGGIPPHANLCRDTHVLSVHNLSLMRWIVEKATWSRADIPSYSELSSYASLFCHELVSYLKSVLTSSREEFNSRQRELSIWLGDKILSDVHEDLLRIARGEGVAASCGPWG